MKYCIEPHPLALVFAGSQSKAGSAHTCNPSLPSLESQIQPNKYMYDTKRSDLAGKIILYSAHRGNSNSNSKFIHPHL